MIAQDPAGAGRPRSRGQDHAGRIWRQHAWANGVALIQRKLQNVLESEGVKPIEVKPGDKFDPAWHEAVTHEENAERIEKAKSSPRCKRATSLADQVLRPALVRVAK